MKTCNLCNKEKPFSEFYSQNKTKADGTPYTYYRPDCKECSKKSAVEWYTNNPEKFKESKRKQNAKPENKAIVNERSKNFRASGYYLEWQRSNKDKVKGYRDERQHKSHNITKEEWNDCKEYFNNECAYCSLPIDQHYIRFNGNMLLGDFHKEHVDHEGLNDITNCVPSCKSCNSSKATIALTEWYNENNPNYSMERLNKIYEWLDLQSSDNNDLMIQ